MAANVKVLEVVSPLNTAWNDAARLALGEALKSVGGVTDFWVSGMSAVIDENGSGRYRIATHVSYVAEDRA